MDRQGFPQMLQGFLVSPKTAIPVIPHILGVPVRLIGVLFYLLLADMNLFLQILLH